MDAGSSHIMKKITQADFKEEGSHQWTLNYLGYRVVARKTDGHFELTIRAKITNDPLPEDWVKILRTINEFYQSKRIAEDRE